MTSQYYPVSSVLQLVTKILHSIGVPDDESTIVATDLIHADQQGRGSHGLLMLSNYVERIRHKSVLATAQHTVLSDFGAIATLDAHNSLGQITGRVAIQQAQVKALNYGLGAVAVKNAFHLGVMGTYVDHAASEGLIALVTSNTRPLMPAPGGAEPVVGNNPIAFGAPRLDNDPIVLDIALSEAAMGKIRLAAAQNREIPLGWATDAQGVSTQNPDAAILGMLLPTGGPKGYGLAVMVDILSGALSDGGYAKHVNGLFGDPAVPYNCSAFFLVMNPDAFGDYATKNIEEIAQTIESSVPSDPNQRVYLPGQRSRKHQQESGDSVLLATSVVESVSALARSAGIQAEEYFEISEPSELKASSS